jgi:HK97 family phage prohead protease
VTIQSRIDPTTGVFTPYDQPSQAAVESRSEVDPEVAAHEARHAAVALMQGVRVTEARADCPSADTAGHVLFSADTDPREKALMILAGEMGQPGWPPDWPSRSGPPRCDEHRLAGLVDELGLDRRGYGAQCGEAESLVASPGVDELASTIAQFLAKGHVLDENVLATFYQAVCPPRTGFLAKFDPTTTDLQHKSFVTATDTDWAGEFSALVAVFNNVDKGGHRIMPGAFTKTLAAWRASGDPVPVIWSHDWKTPDAHIGVAYAKDMKQTDRGLLVKGRLDVDDNPTARRAHKLMSRRSLKEFSFGYSFPRGGQRKAEDGANELIEVDLYEVGPTLKGMNPATELHSVKSTHAPDVASEQWTANDYDPDEPPDATRARARDQMFALLTDVGAIDPDTPRGTEPVESLESQLDRAETRKLRRECDRIRLAESLGWDADLIKEFGL